MDKDLAVNNLVGLLDIYAPQHLKALNQRFPGSNVLVPGITMGDAHPYNEWNVSIAVTLDSLKILRPLIEPAANSLQKKLALARRMQLGGEILGAVGSSGVIMAWFGQNAAPAGTRVAAIVAAVIAFIGSVTALFVRFQRQDLFGAENAALKQYMALRDAGWRSRLLIAQLESLIGSATEIEKNESIVKLVADADALAKEVHQVLHDLGISFRL